MSVLSTNTGRELGRYVDEIDGQVEKISRLIEGGSRLDPELAAGLATTETMSSIQKNLDRFEAGIEGLIRDLRSAAVLLEGFGARR